MNIILSEISQYDWDNNTYEDTRLFVANNNY